MASGATGMGFDAADSGTTVFGAAGLAAGFAATTLRAATTGLGMAVVAAASAVVTESLVDLRISTVRSAGMSSC
jgi:hypothetical protein